MENLENEVWKDVVGYEGLYQVSTHGRVKSLERSVVQFGVDVLKTQTILKTCLSSGYFGVRLYNNGKCIFSSVHRLMAIAFLPNPENKPQVNHIDGVKTNNFIENLEWCTRSENAIHAYRHGLLINNFNIGKHSIGVLPPNAKMVLNIQTGIYYDSITAAAHSDGVNLGSLRSWLGPRRRNYSKFIKC